LVNTWVTPPKERALRNRDEVVYTIVDKEGSEVILDGVVLRTERRQAEDSEEKEQNSRLPFPWVPL
jgi:hypothetical protein